jgi:hypothetical protein
VPDQEKPVLAVDVDGVVSLFDFDEPPEEAGFELVDGVVHCISFASGALLRELIPHFDLIWASGWEDRTIRLTELLDLPTLPYLTFGGTARFGSADWKIGPLQEYAAGRPLAWIDDSFDPSCDAWARSRKEPTLLIRSEPHLGLQSPQVGALVGWARSLEFDADDSYSGA